MRKITKQGVLIDDEEEDDEELPKKKRKPEDLGINTKSFPFWKNFDLEYRHDSYGISYMGHYVCRFCKKKVMYGYLPAMGRSEEAHKLNGCSGGLRWSSFEGEIFINEKNASCGGPPRQSGRPSGSKKINRFRKVRRP